MAFNPCHTPVDDFPLSYGSCILVIAPMRLEKLRQVDLNLLIIFAVIAEEKSVTKASARLLLSQPAVSRALQRARSMFQDELVIRSSSGFELTLRGRKILQELEQLLPKIEGLVVPSVFDPKRERSNFRISGPDNVCIALLPHLCRRYTTESYKVSFDFLPWQADAVDMLERGKLDLIFHIDEGLLPAHLSSEKLYREDWICAVARQSKFGDRLTLKQYLAAEHLTVTTLPSVQNIPDKQLAALGVKRRSAVRMPYFGAACKSATRVASISFLDGLAPEAHHGRAARMASRGGAPSFSSGSIWGNVFK